MKTQIIALALVMVVALGATFAPVMAAVESDGSFSISSTAPEVGVITLYQEDGTTSVGDGMMTPQIYYQLGVVVTDANTLNDLTEIKVVINDTGYTDPANSVSQQATYIWTPDYGWQEDGRPADTNTWGTIAPLDCTVPDPLTALSGTWKVKFMPGKVAKETNWMVTVTATSEGGSDTGELTALSMVWWGELGTTDDSFDFGTVELNAADEPIVNPGTHIDFTAITNGNYKLQSNSSNWVNATHSATVTLDWDGTLNSVDDEGHFALKNYGSDTVGSANYVEDSANTITGEDNEISNYSEDGNSEPVYMWLYTASEGIMPYTYSGTYTLELSNYVAT